MTNGQKLAKNYLKRAKENFGKLDPTSYSNLVVFAAFADHILNEFHFSRNELKFLVENCGAGNGCCHCEDFLNDGHDSIDSVHFTLSKEIQEALEGYEYDGHRLSKGARAFLHDMEITNYAATCTPGWAKDAPEIDTSCGQA